jgi:malate synthase
MRRMASLLTAGLRGSGYVLTYNLMEGASTTEISRPQVWQCVRHQAVKNDGTGVTRELVRNTIGVELQRRRQHLGAKTFDGWNFGLAAKLIEEISTNPQFSGFLTVAAYEYID